MPRTPAIFSRRTLLTALVALPLGPRLLRAQRLETFTISGLAIQGADPVAYFDGNGPVTGDAGLGLIWRGAEWRFATDANRTAFEMNPTAYAPQYGGYCAYALAQGALASTDPEAWTLHDGKLYLNFSLSIRDRWREDIPGYVAQADSHWPDVLNG